MAAIKHTDKLFELNTERGKFMYFWCPGCGHCHSYEVPRWNFNGNFQSPTFSPSLRVYTPATEDRPEHTYCHLFVEEGVIKYCPDSPHKLAGQNVTMEPIPECYGGFE